MSSPACVDYFTPMLICFTAARINDRVLQRQSLRKIQAFVKVCVLALLLNCTFKPRNQINGTEDGMCSTIQRNGKTIKM